MPTFNFPKNQIHPDQVKVIYKLVDLIDAKKICEIGSWVGESTSHWASAVKEKGGSVVSVDWFQGNTGTALDNVARETNIYEIFNANLVELGLRKIVHVFYMPSVDASAYIKDEEMDIVFIDASHDYNSIREDIRAWFPKVRRGGIICGHDCEGRDWDEKYINVDVHDHKHHGVIKAVTEAFGDKFNIEERIWWIQKG